jgi:hypothetical protein
MHDHPRDRLGLAQAHVGERPAAIRGLEDAVAERRTLPVVRLARAYVDDAGVRLGNRDVADRMSRVGVEDRLERDAVVLGLPDAAGGEADVEHLRIILDDGNVVDAPALADRPDDAPTESAQRGISGFIDRRGRRGRLRAALSLERRCRDDGERQRRDAQRVHGILRGKRVSRGDGGYARRPRWHDARDIVPLERKAQSARRKDRKRLETDCAPAALRSALCALRYFGQPACGSPFVIFSAFL